MVLLKECSKSRRSELIERYPAPARIADAHEETGAKGLSVLESAMPADGHSPLPLPSNGDVGTSVSKGSFKTIG